MVNGHCVLNPCTGKQDCHFHEVSLNTQQSKVSVGRHSGLSSFSPSPAFPPSFLFGNVAAPCPYVRVPPSLLGSSFKPSHPMESHLKITHSSSPLSLSPFFLPHSPPPSGPRLVLQAVSSSNGVLYQDHCHGAQAGRQRRHADQSRQKGRKGRREGGGRGEQVVNLFGSHFRQNTILMLTLFFPLPSSLPLSLACRSSLHTPSPTTT